MRLIELIRRHKTAFLVLYASVFVGILILLYFYKPMVVSGSSMYPTFHNNDHIVVDKFNNDLSTINRGDVIVFFSPIDEDRMLVKRVIGLPGDVICIKDGSVFVNGKMLKEPYTNHQLESYETIPVFPVPKDCVFVLGDNRLVSADSREWGAVNKSRIYGRYVFKLRR